MAFDKAWRRPWEWEGDTPRHQFLSDAQLTLKILTGLGFAATLLFLFEGWPGAPLVGGLFALAWALWMLSLWGEHRTRRGLPGPVTEGEARAAAPRDEPSPAARAGERRARKAELTLGLEILGGLLLVAVVMAVLLFREAVGLGILLVFAWLAAFGAPYWIAALDERGADEREKAGR